MQRCTSTRTLFAVTAAALALLIAVPLTASADGASALAGRRVRLAGDRDYVRVDFKVADPTGGGEASLKATFNLGQESDATTIGVALVQDGGVASRRVQAWAYGEFKGVEGTNCNSAFGVWCDRPAFDWKTDHWYRVVLDRGGRNANGRLWTLKIIDRGTGNSTTLLRLRSRYDRLATTGSMVFESLYPSSCNAVTAFKSVATKPGVHSGTTASWGSALKSATGCGLAAAAPVDKGVVRTRIVP